MTKLVSLSAGAMTIAGAALAVFGTGVASAQDVVGMTYSDASSEISSSGGTPVLGTVVGDKLPIDECFVVSTTSPVFIDQGGSARDGEVRLNLSCYPQPATAVSPGFSSGNNNPDAKAVRDAVEQQQAESESGVTSEDER